MGNVITGDDKISNYFSPYDKSPRGIVWIDDQFGYRLASKSQRKAFDRRRTLYYDGNRNKIRQRRSQSLGAIIGDIYGSKEELGGSHQALNGKNRFSFSKSFIPRIKLTRDIPIREVHSSALEMFSSPQEIMVEDSETTYQLDRIIIQQNMDDEGRLTNSDNYRESDCEIIDKPDENYFTKNFDKCMKRIEIIEKEQEILEGSNGRGLQTKKQIKRQMTPPPEDTQILPPEEDETRSENEITKTETTAVKTEELAEKTEDVESAKEEVRNVTNESPSRNEKKGWYSHLRKQFEMEEQRSKESSCRVTGATLKTSQSPTRSNENEGKDMRHYFSRLVRSNKSLIDEELPDPDKVQNIRAMFQESLNSALQKNLNRFGGSLQNIPARHCEDQFARPKSAQGNRNEFPAELQRVGSACGSNPISAAAGRYIGIKDNRKVGKAVPDRSKTAESSASNKKLPQTKWSDTTSLSSGVSSDLSSYDTDAECCSREEIEENTTDEELHDEIDDKHYVHSEALEKIRSFGTSVTYFGGQMITCSVGPLLSPTTQAILEEIGEKSQDRKNFTRSFEEFYRKYTENNEPRRKKLGRTRSFGQSDVFHKHNVLNDTEIEMYKNDLEVEIGIRKPTGKNQNSLRQKLIKSNSVGSRFEFFEQEVADKLNEILEAAVELAKREEAHPPEEKAAETTERSEPETEREAKSVVSREQSSQEQESNCLFFGYEKSLLRQDKVPDMEFEEFEVCETIEEKMEKLEENPQNYRLTIRVNQEEEKEGPEDIEIADQEPLDSLEIYLKPEEDRTEEPRHEEEAPECEEEAPSEPETPIRFPDNEVTNASKWPIETSVMVDIQKKDELTPKLITSVKTLVQTKTRTFKKTSF